MLYHRQNRNMRYGNTEHVFTKGKGRIEFSLLLLGAVLGGAGVIAAQMLIRFLELVIR